MSKKLSELRFEEWIEQALQGHGYQSVHFSEYNKEKCVIERELISFIKETQPEKWALLEEFYSSDVESKVIQRISQQISKKGLIQVLREGVKDRGVYLDVVYFKPKSGLNPEHIHLYQQNRFVVVRQLHYSAQNNNSLDMVLFLNGIPLLTLELKNQLTGQNVKHAENQYRYDRDPKEPLFQFKRCLVHFSVDNDRVSMTTRLRGENTFFLPFNRAIENPDIPEEYRTGYLWNEVFQKDSLLDIIENFVVVVEEKEYQYSTTKKKITAESKEVLIFPRYHQLEVIRSLRADVVQKGVGENYLIQHTTGSGKSYSIGWLSHTLTSLFQNSTDIKRLFDTVIVITDRKVLDKQLQNTIKSLEKNVGVVNPIDQTSAQLKQYLEQGKDIIITTVQKFPYISETISNLKDRKFAVIIDEVHSSQSGENAKNLKMTLSKERIIEEHGEEIEDELLEQISRAKQPHISFFGFTGTPKEKTLEIFGKKNSDGQFIAFHLYSMKQSIAEGFTLDVLKNYTTFKRFFKLKQTNGEDIEIPQSDGKKELIKYVDGQEITIQTKVGIMLDHFINKGMKGISGKARGMVVVKSRKDCVKYFREINRQLKERNMGFNALVAFSGEVLHDDGQSYSEITLNREVGYESADIALGLKYPNYRLLIVSNKYQTGFDEPMVHSMYVDKKLGGVQCVQTLSRLNRTMKGKTEPFVLDFVNEPDEIRTSFQKYFTSTALEGETDPNTVYDFVDELADYHLYTEDDIKRFAEVFYDPKKGDGMLQPILNTVVEAFKRIDEEEKREKFRSTLQAYLRLYGYISQIINFKDVSLERLYVFLKYVNKKLPKRDKPGLPTELLDSVELDSLRIQKMYEGMQALDGSDYGVMEPPIYSVGEPKQDEFDLLSHLVEQINQLFGVELTDEDKVLANQVYKKVTDDEEVKKVMNGNNSEANKRQFFRDKIAVEMMNIIDSNFAFYQKIEKPEIMNQFAEIQYQHYQRNQGTKGIAR